MPGKDFACRLGMIQMKFRKSISVAAVAALGLAANAAGKKLIAHGWDTALLTPGEILANAERFDGSPFDGLGVTLPGNDRVMTDAGWTKERFAADCETLRAAGAIAKAAGLRGIMGDIEDYWKTRQFLHRANEMPYAAAAALARRRGREVYRGLFEEYPDMLLLTFMYFTLDRAYSISADPAATMREKGDLLPAFLNGERRDPATGYGYPGAAQDTDVRDLKPVLVECITDGETAADNFSFHQGRGQMISGGMRIYEALVYTNELTNAQRVKVEKYLMDRWIDRGYSPEAAPMRADGVVETLDVSAGAAVGVSDGHDLVVRSVEGAGGNLAKDGRGTLHVMDFDST